MYTIKQVSEKLGIPSVTLRAWEKRYNAVVPSRTDSGYRLYNVEQLEELKWLKDQTENKGVPISRAVQQLQQHRTRKRVGSVFEPAGQSGGGEVLTGSRQEYLDKLYGLLTGFRTDDSHTLVEMGFTMFGYETMVYSILVRLLIRVGDEWEQGLVSVAQEHYITQFVIQRCFRFFTVFPVNSALPKAIAFCPPGEHHHAGLLIFSLFLRKRGVEVLYLGPDTPEDGLHAIISSQNVQIACISLTDKRLQEQTILFMDRLAAGLPDLEFVLGGHGFSELPQPYASWLLPSAMESWDRWFSNRES
ncbi:MerR family transcriptional regulator [Paenibacillus sp. J5C2022]|uniref:MerR family transcriptional regulator n=1 Tax=Paenibacillus sp. J5C2022 TaxID=2977129 RepID=UPI0021CFD079|nr:MerR family transcriptional regulator [Paenibacillus sp. J5C2022]